MRFFDEKRSTTDSLTYKKADIFSQLGCPRCSPNKGCNRWRFGISRSWKDQNKFKKQWQARSLRESKY